MCCFVGHEKKKKIRKRKTNKTEALVQVLEREDKAISKARGHARERERKKEENEQKGRGRIISLTPARQRNKPE